MLDEDLKVWLLEVNRFPALDSRSAHDKDAKISVIDAAWHLAFQRGGMEGLPPISEEENKVYSAAIEQARTQGEAPAITDGSSPDTLTSTAEQNAIVVASEQTSKEGVESPDDCLEEIPIAALPTN